MSVKRVPSKRPPAVAQCNGNGRCDTGDGPAKIVTPIAQCNGNGRCDTGDGPVTPSKISVVDVMSYQHRNLLRRMINKYGWSEPQAKKAFAEMKRFLSAAAVAPKPISPSETVDEIWHNFILFTKDYSEFCNKFFGKFIHHTPLD